MAFLDEVGLAELWELIKAEDAKLTKVASGTYTGTGTRSVSIALDFTPSIVFIFMVASPVSKPNTTDDAVGTLVLSPDVALKMQATNRYSNAEYGAVPSTSLVNFTKTFSNGVTWSVPNTITYGGDTYTFNATGAEYIMNYSGVVYAYIAIE